MDVKYELTLNSVLVSVPVRSCGYLYQKNHRPVLKSNIFMYVTHTQKPYKSVVGNGTFNLQQTLTPDFKKRLQNSCVKYAHKYIILEGFVCVLLSEIECYVREKTPSRFIVLDCVGDFCMK